MNSSGIKRGLAFSAVTALAVVGLPLAANAESLNADMDSFHGDKTVNLYSQTSGVATTKNDGSNTTIRLQAGGTSDINTMRFEYSTDGGTVWNHIVLLSSRNDNGSFAYEWDAAGLAPGAIQVRAVGHSTLDNGDHTSVRAITLQGSGGAANAVSLDDGDELGIYQSLISGADSVIVSGTASAGTTAVSLVNPANVPFGTENLPLDVDGKFKGVLDISGISYPWNAPDELMFRAENGSDDTEAYGVYKQVITTVEARSTGPAPINPGDLVGVEITVKDQKGNPIAGAQVSRLAPGTPAPTTNLGYTDENGQVTSNQRPQNGAVTYVANQTPGTPYVVNPGLGDVSADLEVGLSYANDLKPALTAKAAGKVLDRDEIVTGTPTPDIAVQVKDQHGDDFNVPDSQDLTFYWKITPFAANVHPVTTPAAVQGTEVAGGKFEVTVPNFHATNAPDGTYQLWASLGEGGTGHPVADRLIDTFKIGEAAVSFDGPDHALRHTTAEVTGTLALADGTPLPGRKVQLGFAQGTEYDEHGVPTGQEDALIVSGLNPTTGASGQFLVKVEDLAETLQTVELDGKIQVTSFPNAPFGDWDDDGVVSHEIDFVTDQVPAGAILSVDWDNATANPAGSIEDIDIELTDNIGHELVGVMVDLEIPQNVSKGFFTDGYQAPAVGNYEFTPTNLGDSITVTTDSNGEATAQATIGRDAGFDDDGKVNVKVTGAIGGASDEDTIAWTSDNPLGVSEISLVRTPGQADGPTPTWGEVAYDLYAKDQFGNTVRGVNVNIDCAIVLGDDDNCPTWAWSGQSDYDNGGDVWLEAGDEGTFTWTATADSNKYGAGLVLGADDVTDTATESFYEAVPTDFAISVSPTGNIPVGDVALVTANVLDQEGNPVEGLQVDFVRTGDPNEIRFETDVNGNAVYAFNRTTAGVDTVTAVVRNWNGTVLHTLTTKVTFANPAPAKYKAELAGRSEGARDILVLNGDTRLAGNVARLYRVVGTGAAVKRTNLGVAKLNGNGNVAFRIKDGNGNKNTRYQIAVAPTATTPRVWSNVRLLK